MRRREVWVMPLLLLPGAVLQAQAPAPAPGAGAGDAAARLREFVRSVQSGRAAFTQTVVSPDGARRRTTSGVFEFQRPNRFRFEYRKPFEQLIVADGSKVWIYDADLNQASSRRLASALGSTPAAILAGGTLDAEWTLAPEPPREGLDWVLATPRARDGAFRHMRIGFRGELLAMLEITDSFGQRSTLAFSGFETNPAIDASRFRYTPPPGADVIEQ